MVFEGRLYGGTTNYLHIILFLFNVEKKRQNHRVVMVDKPCVNPVPSRTGFTTCAHKMLKHITQFSKRKISKFQLMLVVVRRINNEMA